MDSTSGAERWTVRTVHELRELLGAVLSGHASREYFPSALPIAGAGVPGAIESAGLKVLERMEEAKSAIMAGPGPAPVTKPPAVIERTPERTVEKVTRVETSAAGADDLPLQARITAMECAHLIMADAPAWSGEVRWFSTLNPQAKGPHPELVGGAFARLMEGWSVVLAEMRLWGPEREWPARMSGVVARRIVLLFAFTFDPDFDGSALGLASAPFDAIEKPGRMTERGWAWAGLSDRPDIYRLGRVGLNLVRTANPAAPGIDRFRAGGNAKLPALPATGAEHALTTDHESVLTVLGKTSNMCKTVIDVASAGTIRNRETLGRLLRELAGLGLVNRPHGRRKGYALTDAGRKRMPGATPT